MPFHPAFLLPLLLAALHPAPACLAEESAAPFVRLYDTGAPSAGQVKPEAVAARRGWTAVPEGAVAHAFEGDAVLVNDRLALVLSPGAGGAIACVQTAAGVKVRATVGPARSDAGLAGGLASVKILENTPAAVAVEATFRADDGRQAALRYRLTVGQPLVEVRPGAGTAGVAVPVPDLRFLAVPDCFGDDMVFRPEKADPGRFGLPAENFLLGFVGDHDSLLMWAWQPRTCKAEAVTAAPGGTPILTAVTISCPSDGRIFLALLEGPDLWHERAVKFADEGTTVALDWRPPFPARWRADLLRPDHTADSWFFSAAGDKDAPPDSPCRLDGDRATVRLPPPAKTPPGVDPRVGPVLVYPIDRSRTTPLTTFCPVDIMRNTLGVGPCQYILETEGLATQDNPTPDQAMTWLEKQFKKSGGKDAADDIRDRLKAMTAQVAQVGARLKRYREFAVSTGALVRIMGSSATAAGAAEAVSLTLQRVQRASEEGLAAGEPERLTKSVEALAALIGRDDAAARVERPAAEIRAVGAAQDRALARCRMATRWALLQITEAAPKDDRAAEKARQVQALTEQILQGK